MAIRDSDYAGSFTIPPPKGIWQADGDTNISLQYACRAQNIRTGRGLIASAAGVSPAFPSLGAPIGTLTRFIRRTRPDDPQVYVAAAGGALYTYTMGTEGWVRRAEGFACDAWSTVTYEALSGGQTVDVLILSNAEDGMAALYGDDLRVERKTLAIGDSYAGVKFAQLGWYAERIWGVGAPGYPDSIFYSRPYSPFDWTGVPETPETGGGVINQPTWDGDSFLAVTGFGGYLLAIKQHTVFEIRGTDPSSFTVSEAYGTDGPIQARTVCADRTSLFYLASGGIGLYDGASARLLSRDALCQTMSRLTKSAAQKATACVCDHVYYLALPVTDEAGGEAQENNAVIEYDAERGTFMLRTGLRVKDFFCAGAQVLFTQADAPYQVMRFDEARAGSCAGEAMDCLWQTAWLDLGKAQRKRDFVLRFTAEADEQDMPLEITLQTDRREKTRTVLLSKTRRDYRVPVQVSGRRVRLTLRAHRRAAGFQIAGGVQIDYTTDGE